jgi:uncharacterized protein involved in exopolysaccharide biosynthesis
MVLAKVVAIFFIIGVLVVLTSRVEYQASATLLPESSSQSSVSNLLRQYGGMFGISAGDPGGSGGISTARYPDIISSLPYQVELMNEPLHFSTLDTTLTAHEYFRDVYPPSILDYIKKYTIGLPGQVLSIFTSNEQEAIEQPSFVTEINRDSVISLPQQQKRTLGNLQDRLTINAEAGLITVTAELPDPQAAAELGRAGIKLLKEYVREYHTQKANEELNFVRQQVEESKKRFEEVQMKRAEFLDSNVNLATAKAQTREQELQSQYDLAFNIFNTLSQNLEQAKLKVQEDTPVFTTLKPLQVPGGSSKPNTPLIMIASIMLGIFFGGVIIVGDKIRTVVQFEISKRQ